MAPKRSIPTIEAPIEVPQGKRLRGTKTTWAQKSAMVEWLEKPPGSNLKLIQGNATSDLKGTLSGAKLTKKDGFKDMADFVNKKCGTKWSASDASVRYKGYFDVYKKTVKKYDGNTGTKYCLGENDFKKGITTLEQKLNVSK